MNQDNDTHECDLQQSLPQNMTGKQFGSVAGVTKKVLRDMKQLALWRQLHHEGLALRLKR